MANLSYFKDSVHMYIELKNSVLHSQDLAYFSKEFRPINDTYQLTGVYEGSLPEFRVKNLTLKFGEIGHIHGALAFSGFFKFPETRNSPLAAP